MTTPSEPASLQARHVSFAYGKSTVVEDVSLSVPEEAVVALAGPNGSGKTSLLTLLSGLRRPVSGEVSLDGRPMRAWSPRERARAIAVVPQRIDPRLAFSVRQMVALGRTPHAGLLSHLDACDTRAVDGALRSADVLPLAERRYSELSGGEQQRVAIAMALAQEARYLLLDEPTVHLDLLHQFELLELLRQLNADRGVAILAVMHDLNLAALYFDRLAVLCRGRLVAEGVSSELVKLPEILDVFEAPLAVVAHPSAGVPQVLLDRSSPAR